MAAFADGMKMGQAAYQMGITNQRQSRLDERDDQRFTREQAEWARKDEDLARQKQAAGDYETLLTKGMANPANQTANRLANQDGLDAAVGNIQQGMAVQQPTYAPELPEYTPATEGQRNEGMRNVMVANRNWDGVQATDLRGTKLKLDSDRKAQYATLGKMKPDELAEYVGGEFSKDGSGMDAMLTYDAKSNKYLFASNIPGFPSQSLSGTELKNMAMGIWEAGNGDFAAGMKMQMEAITAKRGLDNANFERSSKLATGNAELGFKERTAQNNETKTRDARTHQEGMREIYGRRDSAKEPSPEMVTRLNDIAQRWEASNDPAEKARLEQMHRMASIEAATQMGRPMQLGQGRTGAAPKPAITNSDMMTFAEKMAGTRSQFYKDAKGQPLMINQLGPDQIRREAENYFGQSASSSAGGSELDKVLAARAQGRTGAPGVTLEARGMRPQVPGRPLYNADTVMLQQMALRPSGVSVDEAKDARQELEVRNGEDRMKAF
jgi:hypothetical protein